jgi:hypothetical protein
MLSSKLTDIEKLRVARSVVDDTMRMLRESGREGMEAIVLWAGTFSSTTSFDVGLVIRPRQTAYRSSDGLLAAVDDDEIFRVNRAVSEHGMRLVAQLHTHPGDAYHSDTDDHHALVTARGGFSLVVPFFASGGFDLDVVAVYRLEVGNTWQPLPSRHAEEILQIVEDE